MTEDRQLGYSLGAVDFLVKPTDRTRLLRAIEKAAALHPAPHPWTILLIDDEPNVHEILTNSIKMHGHRVISATNGPMGLEMANRVEPNVIIVDLLMPGMSGFEVVRQLRDNPATRSIPVIIFSAKDITAQERTLLARDSRAFISKSAKEELLAELESLQSPIQQST